MPKRFLVKVRGSSNHESKGASTTVFNANNKL